MKIRKITLVLLITLLLGFFGGFSAKAAITKQQIEMIFSTPGEDAATEIGLSWHAYDNICTLLYTEATDTAFTKAIKVQLRGQLSDIDYYEKSELGTYYLFQTELKNLDPDTRYAYRIKCGQVVSKPHYFKTAGYGGSFNFALYSDTHASTSSSGVTWNGAQETGDLMKLIQKAETMTKDIGGIDVIPFAGDFVRYGQNYSNWQLYNDSYISTNYSIAVTMGNHEYYDHNHNGTKNAYWTNAMLNFPTNDTTANDTGYEADYWFLYNNVLFIAFDNIQSHNATLRPWLENVFAQNEGKYQYCIAYHHYPDFKAGTVTANTPCDYGSYALHDVWDKYNVDLVIGADDHVYVRTKSLYQNAVSTNPSLGTVYVTTTNIVSGGVSVSNSSNPWYEKNAPGGGTGGLLFEVTPEKMVMTLYNTVNVVDTYTFTARRDFVMHDELVDEVENSLEFIGISNSDEGYVVTTSTATSIVKQIEIYDGNTLLASGSPLTTKQTAIHLTGLAQNQVKTLKAKITYSNDMVHEVNFLANTYPFSGYASNFMANISGGKVTLSWDEVGLTSQVSQIKLYRGSELLTTLAQGEKSYQFDKTDIDETSNYYLELVNSEGQILHRYSCYYVAYGDINSDGIINGIDFDAISKLIFDNSYTQRQLEVADVNKDGLINYKDLMAIFYSEKHGTSLANDTYVVKFKNIDGTVISKQNVKYGAAATLPTNPTLAGYTFTGWSDGSSYITSDTDIYALYEK